MIGTIIFSRMSSSRLPGKALLKLGDSTLIQQVINSAKKIKSDIIIIATSINPEDDILCKIAEENNISYFRGDLENVAKRTKECIEKFNLSYFIRVNGDSPFIPYKLINKQLKNLKKDPKIEFISNLIERTFPYGYSIEIIKVDVFNKFYVFFSNSEFEHITAYFYNNLDKIKYFSVINDKYALNNKDVKLTIDDKDGYHLIKEFFQKFTYKDGNDINKIMKLILKKR